MTLFSMWDIERVEIYFAFQVETLPVKIILFKKTESINCIKIQ